MIRRLLIANRGEIAVRIMRTAHAMGIHTIAIFADNESNAKHVHTADEAYPLDGEKPADTYLNSEKIIRIAQQCCADAIHPGYGFLSEHADFAHRCTHAGLRFVGPSADAIRLMGAKDTAKQIMRQAGVPVLPGYEGEKQSDQVFFDAAQAMGYPILVKAVHGGGGKGMVIVQTPDTLSDALAKARREAASSFGDDRLLIERYFPSARHIEVQVLADQQGHCIHLFERDCSIQRRYQKVIEEAPAQGLKTATRNALGQTAIRAAQAIQYVGAGTLEFLVDETEQFYFMEMNTRLQVEHPVTECITGIDLVAWQLRIASGEQLTLQQRDLVITGHAIEARLYAEDTTMHFLPATGTIEHLVLPESTTTCRIDHGLQVGDAVTVYYDPMLAKIITHGETRQQACQRLQQALAQCHLVGLKHNRALLYRILTHPAFVDGQVDTQFIAKHQNDLLQDAPSADAVILAMAAFIDAHCRCPDNDPVAWQADGWRLNHPAQTYIRLQLGEAQHTVRLTQTLDGYDMLWQAHNYPLVGCCRANQLRLCVQGQWVVAQYWVTDDRIALLLAERDYEVTRIQGYQTSASSGSAAGSLIAPMPGVITACYVEEGQSIQAGEAVMLMEAMKMEHTIQAPYAGTVTARYYSPGSIVKEGDTLLSVQPTE